MSHNLLQKRGRYPKVKQETNVAQGGWQAQTLSVPPKEQEPSDADYNFQNRNANARSVISHANQLSDQKIVNDDQQQKMDSNGHIPQQDMWNDWGDQGWENWTDNNNCQQPHASQNYFAQPESQAQQNTPNLSYDQEYPQQQVVQQQTYDQCYSHLEQNNVHYPSCSTPLYQYQEEIARTNSQRLSDTIVSTQGVAQKIYLTQTHVDPSPSNQLNNQTNHQLQSYSHETPFQQPPLHQQHHQEQQQHQRKQQEHQEEQQQRHQEQQQHQQESQKDQQEQQQHQHQLQQHQQQLQQHPEQQHQHQQQLQQHPEQQHQHQQQLPQHREQPQQLQEQQEQQQQLQQQPILQQKFFENSNYDNGLMQLQPHESEVSLYEGSYPTAEHPTNISQNHDESYRYSGFVCDSPTAVHIDEQQTTQNECELQPVLFASPVEEIRKNETRGSMEMSQIDEDLPSPSLLSQDAKEEPLSDGWDRLDDNMESLAIRDPLSEAVLGFGGLQDAVELREQQQQQQQLTSVLPSLSEILQAKNFNNDPNEMRTGNDSKFDYNPVVHSSIEAIPKSRTASMGSGYSERRGSFENVGSQERTTYLADIIRPASEGAPAGIERFLSLSVAAANNAIIAAEHSLIESNVELIASREVVVQRSSLQRSAPTGVDLNVSSVRQSPLGGEGADPELAVAISSTVVDQQPRDVEPIHSGRSASQDTRRCHSANSSSSDDSEIAEHNRKMLTQKMREREYELPAVFKRDCKWKSSRERLREHANHSDESEIRSHRRRGTRNTDTERFHRKNASDRDYEDDDYHVDSKARRRVDRRRESDETDFSDYASSRRHRHKSQEESEFTSEWPRRRSDEIRRPRSKGYIDESHFDTRRSGHPGKERNRSNTRRDTYYGRPPSRGSSLNESVATSQISDSDVPMYDTRKGVHTALNRHPAMGIQQVYEPRSFQSTAGLHAFHSVNANLHVRQHQQLRPQQNRITSNTMGGIPHELTEGQDLQFLRRAYETDPDYRYVLDNYFVQCAHQGYDISQVQSYICSGTKAQQSISMTTADLNESMNSSIAFAESSRNEEPSPPGELKKFSMPHAFAGFTSLNTLVKIPASQKSLDVKPPVIEIHDLKLLLEDEPESRTLAKFPGPLVRADTHKNQVIHFCNQRIGAIRKNKLQTDRIVDRESYVLLWELLILLLRQNGHVTGTDIAELLLKDAHYVDPASVQKLAEQEMSQVEESDKASSDESEETVDGTRLDRSALRTRRQGLSHDQALARFRELLLFGHRREAIEHAIRYELWGHAFCLSSKLDMKMYTYVHSKFYQSFAGNDPLQTIYQLYSGRQPSSVTCLGDITWGDWRPHLAMILANPSVRPEVDARSIITMGDILLSRGCLCAAHFCYLMAQVDFGNFTDKGCKLVLLGSNHTQKFIDFATNEAIVCTEIYEYAQSLSNPGYTLPTLGLYKYLHAKRLIDYGFVQEGLHYCERLAIDIVRNFDAYKPQLVHEVYRLASRLRYNDAHYSQGSADYDELGDPEWLSNLEQLDVALQSGVPLERIVGNLKELDSVAVNMKPEPQYGEHSDQVQQQQFQQMHNYYQQQQQPLAPQYSYSSQPQDPLSHDERKEEIQTNNTLEFKNESYSRSSSVDDTHKVALLHQVKSDPNVHKPTGPHGKRQSIASISSSITSATTSDSISKATGTQNEISTYQQRPMTPVLQKLETKTLQAPSSAGKKSTPTSQAGRSWLGGIFGKFLPKGPNQMILPEDKNQSIVWDEDKKCWVDRNADPSTETATFAPPPSDISLGAGQIPTLPLTAPCSQVSPAIQPVMGAQSQASEDAQNVLPSSGSNRFQRITRKPFYVDVLKQNQQTASVPSQMAPILEGSVSPLMVPSGQPQFFIPAVPSGGQDEPFDLMSSRAEYDDPQQNQDNQTSGQR